MKAGLTLGGTDARGANLLHLAAGAGQFGLIDALLARGVEWRQPDDERSLPFMHLLAWYFVHEQEPGPELEEALIKLTQGLPDVNVRGSFFIGPPGRPRWQENGFSIARIAAVRPRVRQVFGERIDYAHLGGPNRADAWRFTRREEARALIADLTPEQLRRAVHLTIALQDKGWDDLALEAARKR